jgi:hypothetical protein
MDMTGAVIRPPLPVHIDELDGSDGLDRLPPDPTSLPPDPMSDQEWAAFVASVPTEPTLSADELLAELLPDHRGAAAEAPDGPTEWPSPRLVDDTDPGPLLAALVTEVDTGTCSDDALVGLVGAAGRLQAWASSVELGALAALTRRTETWQGVAPAGKEVPDSSVSSLRMAATEVAPLLALSPTSAMNLAVLAHDLTRLPATRAALAAGRLDKTRARLVADELRPLPDETAAAIDAKLVPASAARTYAQLRACLRRAVIAIDPAAAQARHDRALADRAVTVHPGRDGMATMTYTDAAQTIDALWTFITGAAHTAQSGPDDTRTLDQRRADVLGDLGHTGLAEDTTHPDQPAAGAAPRGRGTPRRLRTVQGRRPQIQVVVSIATLLCHDQQPAELAGYGPITAETARRIAVDGTWRRLLTDPRTGRLDELSLDTHDPPQDLVDHLLARDPYCRGPGCRRPARLCDLDHRIPHPEGRTEAGNLNPLCRPEHGVKTHTATTHTDDGDGGLLITYPSGRTHHIRPEPVLPNWDDDPPPF